MIDHDHAKHIGDGVALAFGSVGTLAQWSSFAGEVTPILSMCFVGLSVIWILWRMIDRVRFGAGGDDD